MARPRRNPDIFLRRLEKALAATKPKAQANLGEMAAILEMTPANLLNTYIKPDASFPIAEVGSEGRGYRFMIQVVLRHLIKRTKAGIAANAKRNAEQAERLDIEVAEEDSGISIAEVREQIDLTLKVQAEKRRQQGELDPVRVSAFLAGYNQVVRDTIMGTGGAIDPVGELDPVMRARFDDHMRDLCLKLEARVVAFSKGQHASALKA